MTWRIVVKPSSYTLSSYAWTAQRSDNEAFLMGERTLPTREAALEEAKEEVTVWEEHRALVESNTLVEEAFDPLAVPE